MLRVGAGVREALATLVTLVRLFSRVQTQVLDQVVLVFESFAADPAFMRTFTCKTNGKYLFHFDTVNIVIISTLYEHEPK